MGLLPGGTQATMSAHQAESMGTREGSGFLLPELQGAGIGP